MRVAFPRERSFFSDFSEMFLSRLLLLSLAVLSALSTSEAATTSMDEREARKVVENMSEQAGRKYHCLTSNAHLCPSMNSQELVEMDSKVMAAEMGEQQEEGEGALPHYIS